MAAFITVDQGRLNKETGYKQKLECRENIGCELQCGMEETGFGTRLSKV